MKTFEEFINEQTESEFNLPEDKELHKSIKDMVNRHLPNFGVGLSKGALSNNTLFLRVTAGKTKSEFPNGILQNDPIRFVVMMTEDNGQIIGEFSMRSIQIAPMEVHMAYSSKRVPLRKFRSKTTADLLRKLEDAVKKLKAAIVDARDNGQFGSTLKVEAVFKKIHSLR